ncbi:Transcription elongation factor [Rhizoctonia solani]|uniref:Transcription elongation factor n=1 Tax=Rhizoctonia solani TaxID=456999 RepID=A0A8H7ID01_9AGAM|nr:Transcription elongation factor [Rhizoctonia solani]
MEAAEVKKLIKTSNRHHHWKTRGWCHDSEAVEAKCGGHRRITQLALRLQITSHPRKEIADLAKELVKKWKEAVEAGKKVKAAGGHPRPLDCYTVRTVKNDAVKIESKGDKTRDKCMELLYDAMASDSGAPIEQILKRVYAIEYQVYKEFDGDKKNPGLREAVVSGDISAEKFVKMTPEEMASEERKQQNSALNEANVHAALGAGEPEAETDAFQCGRCKNFKTRYRQAQTRSADEPMTTLSRTSREY